MIWQQSLDIYFSHFELIYGEQRLEEAGKGISDLLIELSNGVFSQFRGGMISRVKVCLLESLKFLEKAQYKEYTNAPYQSLLQSILPIIHSNIIRYIELAEDDAPFKEWYLLFWCLDKSSLHAINLFVDECDSKKLSETIVKSIYNSYSLVMQKMLNGSGLGLDGDAIFDQLDWKLMFDLSGRSDRASLITILDTKEIIAKQVSSDNRNTGRQIVTAIRMHIRLLMNIYSRMDDHRSNDACNIAHQLVNITNLFGFGKESVRGIFDIIIDGSDNFSRVYLWERLVCLANSFEDSTFHQFINQILNTNTPWRSILTLYKETVYESRRIDILNHINKFDIGKNRFITVPEMRDTLLLAVNSGLTELADTLLEYGKNNVREMFKPEWSGIEYKINLQKIYQNTNMQLVEKDAAISEYKLPLEITNTNGANITIKQDLEQYKRFILALLYFETDPAKCYRYLNALCNEKINPMYASNRLAARIKIIESSSSVVDKVAGYKLAIIEWNDAELKIPNHKRSMFENKLLLICYSNINDVVKFNEVWDRLPEYEQASYDLVQVRCKFLQDNDFVKDGIEYLETVRKLHNVIPESMAIILDKLKDELLNKHSIESKKVDVYVSLMTGQLSVDQARNIWLEIKEFKDSDHAKIFRGSHQTEYTLEQFVIDNVIMVANELLLRGNNLQRLTDNNEQKKQYTEEEAKPLILGESTVSLEGENIINDWFVSLFEHRMSYLSWRVADQKRSGCSPSGINPGNPDAWISNSRNNRLFLFEAFRLLGLSTNVIDEHIDKLAGYDSIGCSPIIVAVYCYVADFNDLCSKYISHLESRQYKGFDFMDLSVPNNHFELVENLAKLRVYKEMRYRETKHIIVYHVMLSFKSTN